MRRTFLEQQSGKEDVIEEQAKRRSRRDRVTLSNVYNSGYMSYLIVQHMLLCVCGRRNFNDIHLKFDQQ